MGPASVFRFIELSNFRDGADDELAETIEAVRLGKKEL